TLTITEGAAIVQLTVAGTNLSNFSIAGLDASGTGILIIDPPADTAAILSGATTEIATASGQNVDFVNNNGTTGKLVLDDSAGFTGAIFGFAGDGTIANSDTINLKDINFANPTQATYTKNGNGTGGILTVSDGTHTASINFVGGYALGNFVFASDGNGGTLIVDGPVTILSGTTTEIAAASMQNVAFAN